MNTAAAPASGACSLFKRHDIPLTIFAVAMAAQRHPEVIKAMVADGHEICSHGYRWIDYQYMDEAQEREHMLEAIRILTELTGERPLGWYTGRTSPNTRRLVREEGGFLYDSDTYDDDLPYWDPESTPVKPHLVIPIRWTPTTCASPRCRASTRVTTSTST